MSLTPLNAYERETVVVFNDGDELATVTSHQRRILTKLERNPAAVKTEDLRHGSQPGARFTIPARLISFRSTTRRGSAPGVRSLANLRHKPKE